MTITTLEQWLDDIQEVTLPSGKIIGAHQFDILHVLTDNGEVPTILRPLIDKFINQTAQEEGEAPAEPDMDADSLSSLSTLLDKVVDACWAQPPIVETMQEVRERKGIHKSMISMTDKQFLMQWAMGGSAVAALQQFPSQPSSSVPIVRAGKNVPGETEQSNWEPSE